MIATIERPKLRAGKTRLAPLSWRRPVKDTLETGTRRRSWRSLCGRYRLEEHRRTDFINGGATVIRDCVYIAYVSVTVREADRWHSFFQQLSFHRSRAAAIRSCEQHRRGR
jgi:hypothetical protein